MHLSLQAVVLFLFFFRSCLFAFWAKPHLFQFNATMRGPILTWAAKVKKKSRSLFTGGTKGIKRKVFRDSKRCRTIAIFCLAVKKTKNKTDSYFINQRCGSAVIMQELFLWRPDRNEICIIASLYCPSWISANEVQQQEVLLQKSRLTVWTTGTSSKPFLQKATPSTVSHTLIPLRNAFVGNEILLSLKREFNQTSTPTFVIWAGWLIDRNRP